MSGQKRQFPYYSAMPEIQLKQRAVSGINPGKERANVRTFAPGNFEESPASAGGSEVCSLPAGVSRQTVLENRKNSRSVGRRASQLTLLLGQNHRSR